MEEAQVALQTVVNNAQDEAAALSNPKLIQAIGRGIGSTAAHEIAHQFLLKCCSMDVKISSDPNAAGTYNNGDADADPNPQIVDSDPSPYTGYWKDGKTPIKWESTTQAALTKCLGSGWTNYGLQACSSPSKIRGLLAQKCCLRKPRHHGPVWGPYSLGEAFA